MKFNQQFNIKAIFNIKAFIIKLLITLTIFMLAWSSPIIDNEDSIFASILLASVILIPGVLYMLYNILSYAKQEYIIREDGISSINSFMGYAKKDLSYLEVREVQLGQTFFQKMFGLGSVYISTNAISFDAGLAFFDIRDSEAIYHEIQKRVTLAKELEKQKMSK